MLMLSCLSWYLRISDRLDLNCWSVHNEETFTLNRFHPGFEFDMTLMCDAEEING